MSLGMHTSSRYLPTSSLELEFNVNTTFGWYILIKSNLRTLFPYLIHGPVQITHTAKLPCSCIEGFSRARVSQQYPSVSAPSHYTECPDQLTPYTHTPVLIPTASHRDTAKEHDILSHEIRRPNTNSPDRSRSPLIESERLSTLPFTKLSLHLLSALPTEQVPMLIGRTPTQATHLTTHHFQGPRPRGLTIS